jgi:uncharacterized protein YndB with AHSA1/START domain
MTSVTIVRHIKAQPEAVFEAFVEPAEIAQWWSPGAGRVLSAEVDPRVGGRFHIRFEIDHGKTAGADGVFDIFDPPHRLALSWAWDADPSEITHLEIVLKSTPGGTELTLIHSKLTDADRSGTETGWNAALDNLERLFKQEN